MGRPGRFYHDEQGKLHRDFSIASKPSELILGKPYMTKSGYWYTHSKNHPKTWISSDGIQLHRVIMEQHLGRFLTTDETVHHIDGTRTNNDISNLQVVSRAEHAKLHGIAKKDDNYCSTCNKHGKTITKKDGRELCVNCNQKESYLLPVETICSECATTGKKLRKGLCGSCYNRARRLSKIAS